MPSTGGYQRRLLPTYPCAKVLGTAKLQLSCWWKYWYYHREPEVEEDPWQKGCPSNIICPPKPPNVVIPNIRCTDTKNNTIFALLATIANTCIHSCNLQSANMQGFRYPYCVKYCQEKHCCASKITGNLFNIHNLRGSKRPIVKIKIPRPRFLRKDSLPRKGRLPLGSQGLNKPTDFPLQGGKKPRYQSTNSSYVFIWVFQTWQKVHS